MDAKVKSRFDRSRRFEACAAAILGLCFFRQASKLIDQEHHGDLVFQVDSLIVGVRVQSWANHGKWGGDNATFRVCTQSGRETEWTKILAGTGPSHFLSCFEDPKHPCKKDAKNFRIGRWVLLDMNKITKDTRTHGPFSNHDGSTFRRLRREDFPSGSLVRSGHYLRVDPEVERYEV